MPGEERWAVRWVLTPSQVACNTEAAERQAQLEGTNTVEGLHVMAFSFVLLLGFLFLLSLLKWKLRALT